MYILYHRFMLRLIVPTRFVFAASFKFSLSASPIIWCNTYVCTYKRQYYAGIYPKPLYYCHTVPFVPDIAIITTNHRFHIITAPIFNQFTGIRLGRNQLTMTTDSEFIDGVGDTEMSEGNHPQSKKGKKKLDKRLAKAQRTAEVAAKERSVDKEAFHSKVVKGIESEDYGVLPLIQSTECTSRQWVEVSALVDSWDGEDVWIRGRLQSSRRKGPICFIVLRQQFYTVQCVLDAHRFATPEMVKWASMIPFESVVDIYGKVVIPDIEVAATSQKVEILLQKIFCVSKSVTELPFLLKDANQSYDEQKDDAINVNQDTRLDNRILDLRTLANQAIFKMQSMVCQLFREFLLERKFVEIHSPKLLGGASEGGSTCFSLPYFNQMAFLAQSPQLYKQMVLCGDMDRVFEIGPVFRAENSNTYRHLCEFVGLDLEMTFKEHYFEVLGVIDEMFRYIFDGLTIRCSQEIEVIKKQHPSSAFTWLPTTPRLDYVQGLQLLRDHGCEGIPENAKDYDIGTEEEKLLGQIIKKKYNTDYYILIRYPTSIRPFYSMPCADDPTLTNSYDLFMRGEEICSGAQRIHDCDLLANQAKEKGIAVETLKSYIDSFSMGAFPHAGGGIGLERVLMLFLGLPNIRKVSLFPRDPKRLTP